MSKAWMPLYVGDYLADTRHLTTTQHGAYLLLIMHYWQHGGLPDDEVALMQIVALTGAKRWREWRSIRLAIARFFEQPGWRHKRIDAELKKSEIIREKRQISGRIGGLRKNYKGPMSRVIETAIAKQTGYQSQSHKESSSSEEKPANGKVSDKSLSVSPSLAAAVRARGW